MIALTTIVDDLARLRLLGADPCLPVPPDCADLWQRGQAAGGCLRTLYWLNRPLNPGQAGGWTPDGDVWVWDLPATPGRARTHLLHEIAHGLRNRPPARSIDAHWDEEAATWQQARALALAWGREDLLSAAELAARLAEGEQARDLYHATAELAGTADLPTVRGAFAALCGLRAVAGWDAPTFAAALWGEESDAAPPPAGALPPAWAVLEFDRGHLRAGWRLSRAPEMAFGPFTRPVSAASVRLLRAALRQAMQPVEPPTVAPRPWLTLAEEPDLAAVIGAANALLLAHPDTYAEAQWTCYADAEEATPGARIYHLSVEYISLAGPAPPAATLWILVAPYRPRWWAVEAALQQYMRGWQEVHSLTCAPLIEGLRRVWGQPPPAGGPETGRLGV